MISVTVVPCVLIITSMLNQVCRIVKGFFKLDVIREKFEVG
jgi:hypothetical protein